MNEDYTIEVGDTVKLVGVSVNVVLITRYPFFRMAYRKVYEFSRDGERVMFRGAD